MGFLGVKFHLHKRLCDFFEYLVVGEDGLFGERSSGGGKYLGGEQAALPTKACMVAQRTRWIFSFSLPDPAFCFQYECELDENLQVLIIESWLR